MKWLLAILVGVIAFAVGFFARPLYDDKRFEEHRAHMEEHLREALPVGSKISDSRSRLVKALASSQNFGRGEFEAVLPPDTDERLRVYVEVDGSDRVKSVHVIREKL